MKRYNGRQGNSILEPRISSLEVQNERLHEDVANLNSSLKSVAEEMRIGFQKISESRTTNWGAFASWTTVILMIIGIGMSGYVRDLSRLEETNNDISKRLHKHEMLDGHAAALKLSQQIFKHVEKLDENLQREMRLLDVNISAATQQLDKRLQNEMALLDKIQLERIKAIEKQLSRR